MLFVRQFRFGALTSHLFALSLGFMWLHPATPGTVYAASSTDESLSHAITHSLHSQDTDESHAKQSQHEPSGTSGPNLNRVIIKLNPIGSDDAVGELQSEINATVIHELEQIEIEVWEVEADNINALVDAYSDDPRVAFIVPDSVISLELPEPPLFLEAHQLGVGGQNSIANDSYLSYQWPLHNIGQDGGTEDADIDALEAWQIITGTSVIVGVIDSGVDYQHEDLANNIWINPGEVANNGIDDDQNGYVDDIFGWDFFEGDNAPMDTNGHGTHVAGTIAAVSNNSMGVTGVSWNAEIMALRFIGPEGWGYLSDAIAAIEYATQMGAQLTNNSWGGGGYSQPMYDAIAAADEAGVLFVAAAGNDTNNNDLSPAYPASYELENVVSVAATTRTDSLSSFSNFGASSVDLGAPGSAVLSTYLGGYAYLNGTSMASPHVAGAAALLWSKFPDASAAQIKSRLLDSVDLVEPLDGLTVTGGRLNLHAALTHFVPAPIFDLVSPDLDFDLNVGEVASATLIITNSGNSTLEWNLSGIEYALDGAPFSGADSQAQADWISVTPNASELISQTSQILTVTIDTAGLAGGLHTGTLHFESNDLEQPQATVVISAAVQAPLVPLFTLGDIGTATYWPNQVNPDPTISHSLVNRLQVPIEFSGNDFEIGSTLFSIDVDQDCLSFDDTDEDENGIPDTIQLNLPDDFISSVLYNPLDLDGELDFTIVDLEAPIAAIPSGTLAIIEFGIICQPGLLENRPVANGFSTDPAPSFSDLAGVSIPGETVNGDLSVRLGRWSGDCNGDLLFGAPDISAVIREIFDGDGDYWLDTGGGDFDGSESGCDANGDEEVDAGDLICTILLLFDGWGACGGADDLVGNNASAAVVIGKPHITEPGTVWFPIGLENSLDQIGAVSFRLTYDAEFFYFDGERFEQSEQLDVLDTHLDDQHTVSFEHNSEQGHFDIVIADLTPNLNTAKLLEPVPNGDLLQIPFTIRPGIVTDGGDYIAILAEAFAGATTPLEFSDTVTLSSGDLNGRSLPVRGVNRAITAKTQTAILPPANPTQETTSAEPSVESPTHPTDLDESTSVNILYMPLIGQ